MPITSLTSPAQSSAEIYQSNQANNRPPQSSATATRSKSGPKEILTLDISEEAMALYEKNKAQKVEESEEVLEERELQREANQQIQEEQAERQQESREQVDLFV